MAQAAWRIELKGLQETQKQLEADVRAMQGSAVLAGYRDAALKMLGTAMRSAKVDRGMWRASLHPFVELQGNRIEAGAGSNLSYGPFVEMDTKPHFPPLAPIIAWVHRKHLAGTYSLKTRRRQGSKAVQADQDKAVAYLIARHIARYGTKGDHALEQGLSKNLPWIIRRLERAYSEALGE